MRRSVWLLGAAIFALGGCVVGPNYRAPPPPAGAGAAWRMADPAREAAAEPPDDWWRLYNDPKLDAYVAEAFAANYDLAAAEANLAASRAVLSAARAGRYPSTSVQLGAVHGRDAATDEILGILGHKNETIWKFDDLLDVSYELDLFGHVRRSIESARADSETVAAERDALKVTVAAETTRAYVSICVLGEQIAVEQHSLQVVSRQLEITGRRDAAGDASEFDLVRAQALVSQVRASIPPLEGQRRAALFELAALLGKTPAFAPEAALSCMAPPQLSALIPVGDGASLLRRRPDIREAERRLAAATARIGVATAELYPRITLNGFYGGAAGNTETLFQERGLTWGVGPTISWAFPNQAAGRARVRGSKASAAAALDSFDSAVLLGLKETEQSLAAYGAELDRRQALEDARSQLDRAFELAQSQVAAGAASALDLLTTEQQMVAADAAVASSDAALAQDQIAVFKALGGGWRTGPAAPRPR
jgi:NodT family efflux transporter outer membrane factor (OMF) lipoprotein